MAIKLNNAVQMEELCSVTITKDKFPIIYEAKVKELKDLGLSDDEIEKYMLTTSISLELYYSPTNGLFAVESDAIECGATIHDPYTGEEMLPYEQEE